jgi:Flp pilus assembly protein CpaB
MSAVESRLRPAPNGSTDSPQRSRRLRSQLTPQHWLALVAFVVAFVLIFAALRDRRETVLVAVARNPIPAATRVTNGMVRSVELPADSPLLAGMVELDDLSGGEWVTTRPVAEGEPLTDQALAGDLPEGGLRAMSLPVPREHAAGGDLSAGDRVDVLGVVGADAGDEVDYVATDIEVLAVGAEHSGAVGSRPSEFAVTVAVDGTQARRLARALAAGSVEVVRSTGADPVPSPATGEGS